MSGPGELLYFAYGSNLHVPRMTARVPSARTVAVARLPGFRLAFRKRAADGSMKCDVEPAEDATVWGVVYRLDAAHLPNLDAAEGEGYARVTHTVTRADGEVDFEAVTYRARDGWLGEGRPHDWYRDLVLVGARDHRLPEPWVAAIAGQHADPDPDPERARANRPGS